MHQYHQLKASVETSLILTCQRSWLADEKDSNRKWSHINCRCIERKHLWMSPLSVHPCMARRSASHNTYIRLDAHRHRSCICCSRQMSRDGLFLRQTGQYPHLVHFLCQEGTSTNRWHHFLLRTITQEQARSLQNCCHRHNNPDHSQEHAHRHTNTLDSTIVSSTLSIRLVYWHNFEALCISVCLCVSFSWSHFLDPFLSASYLVSFIVVWLHIDFGQMCLLLQRLLFPRTICLKC